jgi:hypothetical protein
MRRTVLLILVLVVVVAGGVYLGTQVRSSGHQPSAGETGPAGSGPSPTTINTHRNHNPFGVFFNPRAFDVQTRIQMAQELGVKYFRTYPALVPTWNGQCLECQPVHDAGLQFVLTVRNSPSVTDPASPPTDLAAYKQTLASILSAYRPAVLVVENEEDTPTYWTGSPDQYVQELRAACEVSHSMGIPCANGGLVSVGVSWLVYQHLLDTHRDDEARAFVDHGLQPFQKIHLDSPDYIRGIADDELRLVKSYPEAGIDYINFHWYVADDVGFQDAVDVMKELSGLPAISNEIGQHDTDPNAVVRMMDKVIELNVPYAVWFSSDGRLAKALVDPDGQLRPNGEAFRQVIDRVFGG